MKSFFLGIDIGNSQTKLALLGDTGKPGLLDTFIFPSSFEPTQASFRKIDSKVFVHELTKAVPLSRLKTCRIAVNIPANLVTAMSLFLPVMGKKELVSAAVIEAKRKMIPAFGPHHTFESLLLGERIINKVARYEVLMVRTDILYINDLVDIFRKNLGITPVVITPSSFVFPLLPFFNAQPVIKDKDMALLGIGLNSISIAIFREGKLSFFRNAMYGMQDIIQDFAQHLGFSEGKTEEMILDKGIPEVAFDLKDKEAVAERLARLKNEASLRTKAKGKEEEIPPFEMRMLWQAHIDRILHEFRRSLSYYKEQTGGRQVESIFFTGGACHIQNFVKVLTEHIGGNCKCVWPFEGIQVPAGKDKNMLGSIFTGAASLALSAVTKGKPVVPINFLPSDLRKKDLSAKRRPFILLTFVIIISIFGLVSLQLFLTNVLIRKKIRGIDFELNRIKRISNRLKDLSQREKIFSLRMSQVETVVQKNQFLLNTLTGLPKAMPSEVYLTNLNILENKLEIKARIFADYEEAINIVDEFQQNLKTLASLSSVAVSGFKVDKIAPQLSEGGERILLDGPQEREFSISAELVTK